MGKEKLTVKQWRVVRGETQKNFAEAVGIKLSTYKTKESGRVEWTGSELVRIATYIAKSLDTDIKFT